MKLKLTKKLTLKNLLPDIKASFLSDNNRKALKEEIIDYINRGKSPVDGFTFKNYSKAYAKVKGKSRPVDMLVTGTMLRSLQIRAHKNSFILKFNSKIAAFHNETGRVIRRLLPTNSGEKFKTDLQKLITRALEVATKLSVNKQNKGR